MNKKEYEVMYGRYADCYDLIYSIKEEGLVPKTLKVASQMLGYANQLVLEQMAHLQKLININKEDEPKLIWERAKRCYNKIVAIAEICPTSCDERLLKHLSNVARKIASGSQGVYDVDERVMKHISVSPKLTHFKEQKDECEMNDKNNEYSAGF